MSNNTDEKCRPLPVVANLNLKPTYEDQIILQNHSYCLKGFVDSESTMSSHISNKDKLPRETIKCMKIAMQELVDQKLDPIKMKLNQLLDTKLIQEEQKNELTKLKKEQSKLYRRCLKTENESNKLKARLEKLECGMLDSNLILHGLREDARELEEN